MHAIPTLEMHNRRFINVHQGREKTQARSHLDMQFFDVEQNANAGSSSDCLKNAWKKDFTS